MGKNLIRPICGCAFFIGAREERVMADKKFSIKLSEKTKITLDIPLFQYSKKLPNLG
jgi:hypothetical protein